MPYIDEPASKTSVARSLIGNEKGRYSRRPEGKELTQSTGNVGQLREGPRVCEEDSE